MTAGKAKRDVTHETELVSEQARVRILACRTCSLQPFQVVTPWAQSQSVMKIESFHRDMASAERARDAIIQRVEEYEGHRTRKRSSA